MDAVTFLKEKNRLTKQCSIKCSECRLSFIKNEKDLTCSVFEKEYPEKVVEIVENWSKEHPIKTRQNEFLKIYPNVMRDKDVIGICPLAVDTKFKCCEKYIDCVTCKKKYWLEDIGE